MIQTTKDHLHRNCLEWFMQCISHLVSEVNQHRIEQLGHPYLDLHSIGRTTVKVSQTKQAFDNIKRILNTPPLVIESYDTLGGEFVGVSHICQITIPFTAKQHFYQTHFILATRLFTAQLDNQVMNSGYLREGGDHLIGSIALQTGNESNRFS